MGWTRVHHVDEVKTYVDRTPGVYRLFSTDGGPVRYIGRSDSDLLAEINQQVRLWREKGRMITYFSAKATTKRNAFDEECYLWHYDCGDLNERHPAAPAGVHRVCPYCAT